MSPQLDQAEGPPRIGKRRVLIVDDNRTNQLLLELVLKGAGFVTKTVASGDDALDALHHDRSELKVDAVIIDVCMPEISGTETIKLLRMSEVGVKPEHRLPVIAISADDSPQVEQDALSAGADRFLARPVRGEDIIGLVTTLVDQRENAALVEEPAHLSDHAGFRPAPSYLVRGDVLDDLERHNDSVALQQLAAALRSDTDVALNHMRVGMDSGRHDVVVQQTLNIVSASTSLGAPSIKTVYEQIRSIRPEYMKVVVPLLIERLQYEVQVLATAIEERAAKGR